MIGSPGHRVIRWSDDRAISLPEVVWELPLGIMGRFEIQSQGMSLLWHR